MPVACPHCQSPVERADLDSREILCPAYGSSFRLERDSTVVWASSRGPRTLGKPAGLWRSASPVLTVIEASKKPRAV
jgi:nitrite reductase/ring-hydroxylating ferredoxin subunit